MDLLSSAKKQQSDKPANQLPPKQTEIKLGAMIRKYPDLSESILRPIFEDISKLLCNGQSKASWKIRFEFEKMCSTSEIPWLVEVTSEVRKKSHYPTGRENVSPIHNVWVCQSQTLYTWMLALNTS